MKKFYVIGRNTKKSLSPLIFNYWFKKYKIDAKYEYLQLNKTNFDKEIKKILLDKRTRGLNITIPFKKKIMKHIDMFDQHSKKIKAVNCVSIGKKTLGINTDWEGYFKTLPKLKNIKKRRTIIIGYGGAAQAIHYVLVKKGFKEIDIFNRSKKKLLFIKDNKFTKNINTIHDYLYNAEIIINTTPTNPIKNKYRKLINKKTLLSDIVYQPKETKFLIRFPNNKKTYGISMLLEQAVPCFKLWFGFTPSLDLKLIKELNKKIS